MAIRGRPPSTKTLVDRQLGRNIQHPILPAGDSFIIPNHSGDHSEGRVDSTPTLDKHIANKLYVDGQISTKTWLLATDQTGITGDKTGTFKLTTTGNCAFGNVEPFDDDTYHLGHQAWRWKSLYLSEDANIGGGANISGTVGIGTTTPEIWGGELVISKSVNPRFTLSQNSVQAFMSFEFKDNTAYITKDNGDSLIIGSKTDATQSTITPQVTINFEGKMGIGTTTPDEKLEVVGNIKATGTLASGIPTFTISSTPTSVTFAEVAILGGAQKMAELRFTGNIFGSPTTLGSIRNNLYIRSDESLGRLLFSNNSGSETSEIRFTHATDVLSFRNAIGGYTFDNDVECPKIKLTPLGGYAVKLTNKTGANSIKGEIVIASTGTALAVALAGANETSSTGVFLEDGVSDGSEAWVVTGGLAEVKMDAGGCALGDRIIAGATAGRGTVSNTPAIAVHFQEIAHAHQIAAANGLAICAVHLL